MHESTGLQNWSESTSDDLAKEQLFFNYGKFISKILSVQEQGRVKKMLMCLDYIKDLRLTERKGGKSANGKSTRKRHYYITANAHKTSPIKI